MSSGDAPMKDWQIKQLEYEQRMARVKNAKLRTLCTICGAKAKLPCPCGTTQYCSVACQKVDWRERGHRTACKKIRDDRAAEAARAEAPTRAPEEVFYGPAPRSHADEVRARIAAEHEAARVRREANPEPVPISSRYGPRCPICMEDWDVNETPALATCCCRKLCNSCAAKALGKLCPLCRVPCATNNAEWLARLRRHVENEVPEAIHTLGLQYMHGRCGLGKNTRKAAKIFKRAVELGNADAMTALGRSYSLGDGVKLDKKKAMRLFRVAADRGGAWAQKNLARELEIDGEYVEALHYLRLSAAQGLTQAEGALGFFLMHDWGSDIDLEVDLVEAKYWLERAAAKGEEQSIEALASDKFRAT